MLSLPNVRLLLFFFFFFFGRRHQTVSILSGKQHLFLTSFLARLMSWMRGNDLLRVRSTPVPPNILPNGLQATLTDVRVAINAKARNGPPGDDAIYAENAEIRAKVSF